MTPWVTRLIIANVLVFFVTLAAPPVTSALLLVPALILSRPWTLFTYMFLHADLGHLFFNMLGLFFFGPRLESWLGERRFLWLYFVSGVMGALLSFVFTPFSAIIGASGAVFGVFFGFAYYWPRDMIYIWGIFPIEARWLVTIMTALSLFGGFGGSGSGIAHFAHLGGFVGGFLYLKWLQGRPHPLQPRVGVDSPGPTISDLKRWAKIPREEMHEVNRSELERILEKMKKTGTTSLTPEEREFLDRFSSE